MPLVKVSILKGRSNREKKELLNIIHSSLAEAFKIPDRDRVQRLYEFDHDDFEIPSDRTLKFTIIEITILPGRSFEAKKHLYRLIFSGLKTLGYHDNDAAVVLSEPALENWGVRGGVPASEIEIGFNLKV